MKNIHVLPTEEQNQHLIDIMRGDEELGLYEEAKKETMNKAMQELIDWAKSLQYNQQQCIDWMVIKDKAEQLLEKEESKQYPIGGYAPGYYDCTCTTCKTKFTGDKRAFQCEPCAIKTTQEHPKQVLKQETIEDAAERISKINSVYETAQDDFYQGFIAGAKWQQERMYSEEDMRRMYDKSCGLIGLQLVRDQTENNNRFKKIFEQFKNK
jgi:hypothetical protein